MTLFKLTVILFLGSDFCRLSEASAMENFDAGIPVYPAFDDEAALQVEEIVRDVMTERRVDATPSDIAKLIEARLRDAKVMLNGTVSVFQNFRTVVLTIVDATGWEDPLQLEI